MYNDIFKVPWFGLNDAIEQRHIYMKNRVGIRFDSDKDDLLGFSPGAIYHYTHFKEVGRRRSEVLE